MSVFNESEIVIRIRSGRVTATMPRFGLYAKADQVTTALERLEKKKNELEAELSESEIVEQFPAQSPSQLGSQEFRRTGIGQFALKFAIAGVIVAAAVFISGILVSSRIKSLIDHAGTSRQQFLSKLESSLDTSANAKNEMSEERKQKLLSDIRIIAQRWKPFVNEAMQIFSQSPGREQSPPPKN